MKIESTKNKLEKCLELLCDDNISEGKAELDQILDEPITDGYHTMDELYQHRNLLALVLCGFMDSWASTLHHVGTMFDNMFILGFNLDADTQVTYHLPMGLWSLAEANVSTVYDKAPEWDGHTSLDTLENLREYLEGPDDKEYPTLVGVITKNESNPRV